MGSFFHDPSSRVEVDIGGRGESGRIDVLDPDEALGIGIGSDILIASVQALANLLTNAAKYTPGKGRIDIAAERANDVARIIVRDNGMGITQPLLTSLFEPFVQGAQRLDRQRGGLGIGLTLVRSVVELHGGRVGVHSDGSGTGATFTVFLPLATPSP